MGKHSKKRKGRVAQLAEASSAESSRQSTPATSDSEESSEITPPSKKPKTEKPVPVRKGPKTSQDICDQHNLVDVDLQYTEADYMNLTNYGLFVRMVRPQVQEANPSITATKMAALMEAKWREFREGNPFSRSKKPEDILVARNLIDKQLDKKKESPREEKKKKETPAPPPKPKTPVIEWGDDDDDDDDDDKDDDDEEEEEEEEEEVTPKRRGSRGKVPALKIRLPGIKMPTPSSSRKATPKTSAKKSRSKQNSDADSDMDDRRRSSGRSQRASSKRKYKEVSEESNTNDDDDDDTPRRRRQQPKKKKKQSSEEEDVESDDDDFQNRRKKPMDTESDPGTMSESESIDSDEDGDRRSKKKKKAEPKAKPQIPGERKSERSKKGQTVNMSEMTDREFEKMLKEKDKEKEKAEIRKRKREKKKKKKSSTRDVRKLARRGYWQAEKEKEKGEKENGEGGEDDDNHNWFCEVCEDGGELLLCDKCPKSFHKECAKLEIVPEGDWECPVCTGDMSESEDSDSGHEHYCRVCRDGGDVLLCDNCPCVYHMACLNPPMKECPEGDWKCPRCLVQDRPLKGWIQYVMTWRWSNQDQDYDELDHTHSPTKKKTEQMKKELAAQEDDDKDEEKFPERLLFVKYKDYSYWECDWITELQLEVFHPTTWTFFKRKFDQEEPPALEDGSSFGARRHITDKAEDKYKLEDRFYKWGIKPSWLQIHRIINHDTKGKHKIYLIKWQDLGYELATWEDHRDAPDGLEDFDKHIDSYWKRRNERLKAEKEKGDRDKPKKSLLKKKCETQPSYLEETGGKLHPYQLEGLNWLRFSYSQDTNTILADEMGLGKTIQSISFLYVLWKEGYTKGPFLVSAPLSTVPNWEREFQFWAPEMYVLSYSGHKDARQIIREHEFSYREGAFSSSIPGRFSRSHTPKFDVLLTSYEMVSIDKATFSSIEWDVIIIDEAHRLRSNQSLFFKTLSDYRVNYKLLLTGTPLQNNLEELFHLLNFLEPGKFDDIDNFLDNFSEISKDDQVRKLHEMLAPHMLRRMKADVLKDIPSKSEFIVRVELCAMQKKFYKHILTKNYEALNVKGYGKQTSLINIMMDLRKCCNHPYLFPMAEKDAPLSKTGQYEITSLIKNCGKMDLLAKMLKVLKAEGHRVLIFSQMTRVLDILEDFLFGLNYGYERIDGSIMGKLRQAAIDRFNSADSDSFVFLLSTKAGGLGINLATADTVIIFDMDWNPHNDIQAFSRAHRIGQKNKVMIYRFVSRHTVEEKMTQVCKKKMMLTELVIHRNMGAEKTDSLSKQEVNDILRFGAEELFQDDDQTKAVVYDDEAVRKLLDRSQEGEVVEEQEKEFGLNEYLRSFKVASYQVKEGAAAPEVPEEEEEEEEELDLRKPEEDKEYWKRVLGDAYEEHRLQMLQEQENIAASLGKGKRTRRRINYAERVMVEAPEKEKKRVIRAMPEEEEEEEEEDREDLKFFSDYEPDSSADSDDSEEDPRTKEVSPPPQEVIDIKKKRGRMKFIDKIEKEREEKLASKELPPLLSKVNGEIEVLGFTARQRRAFHDAIMRYGMPHEDVYRSQWLVRDLRTVPEKAFKAYVSLFMRHLGEPIKDSNTEMYSDGVPREGLSRQHVLARIGMMALIRKKVAEFERNNGCHSMKIKSIFKLVREVVDAKINKLTDKEENGEEKNEKDEKEEKDADKKEKDSEHNGKDLEKKEKDSEKKEKDSKEKEKESDEKGSEKDEDKDKVKDEEEKESKAKSEGKEETKESISNGTDEKKEKSEEDEDDKKGKNSKENAEEKSKDEEKEKNGKEEIKDEKEEKEETKERESRRRDKKDKSKGKETKSEEPKEKKSEEKTKEEKQMEMLKRQVEERQEKARQLRKVFYIADGGLTDLKNLWNYEEGLLKEENEMMIWHRQHDFWLLTGTITHGYRHWQDILNDPRFELLNRAFNNDADKMRKGAFLNRRFQLLEQALTIEEQLRRELNDNSKLQQLLPPVKDPKTVDDYTDIDRLADLLRSLIKDGRIPAGTDERLIKLLVQIENLVGDIRQASYSGMPATLARAPVPTPRNVQSTQRVSVPSNRSTPVRQILEQRKQDPPRGKGGNIILID